MPNAKLLTVGEWERDEQARVLFHGVWMITLGAVLVGLASAAAAGSLGPLSPRLAPLALTVPPLGLVCLEINRRGHTRPAAWLFLAGYLVLACLRAPSSGGIHSPVVGMFPVMTLFAGITLGRRVGVATAVACAALALGFLLAAEAGVYVPRAISAFSRWVSVCLYIATTLFLLHVALDRTAKALRAARAELASRMAAERRLAVALETGGIGTYQADLDGDHMLFDDQASRILGLALETGPQIARQLARAQILDEDQSRLEAATESLRQGAERFRVEVRRSDADGLRYIEIVATVMIDESGKRIQVGTIADLTDRRLAEAEHAALEARLRSAEQTRAMGSMAGGIAHDFNNILGAIQGFSRLLEEDLPEGSADHRFAKRITDAADRGTAVVEQILTFARQGAQARGAADLGALALELKPLLESLVGPSVTLTLDAAPARLWAQVNSGQMTQVLSNLCRNASDALDGRQGQVTVQVKRLTDAVRAELIREIKRGSAQTTGRLDPDIDYALIQVADDAGGIPPERLWRVFEPFYTTKPRGRGTGLGLAVVQGAAESHGGVCVAQSKLGGGSRFSVLLPRIGRPPPAAPAAGGPAGKGSGRILVVDDEPDITEVLSAGLGRRGYEVVSFNDPRAALAVFEDSVASWRMIITDGMMPDLRGSDLARVAKSLRPDLPVVLYSGFDDASRAVADDAGLFDLRLPKPMDIDEMARRLAEL